MHELTDNSRLMLLQLVKGNAAIEAVKRIRDIAESVAMQGNKSERWVAEEILEAIKEAGAWTN